MLKVPPSLAGTTHPCPACRQPVTVPSHVDALPSLAPRTDYLGSGTVAPPTPPDPPIRFHCPQCQANYESPANDAGAVVQCQRCGIQFRVPDAGASIGVAPGVPVAIVAATDESPYDPSFATELDSKWLAERLRKQAAAGEPWDASAWDGDRPEFLPLDPGAPIAFMGFVGNLFVAFSTSQRRFVRSLLTKIFVAEAAGALAAAVWILTGLVAGVKGGGLAEFYVSLALAVISAAFTYVASCFARAGVNWVYDSPLQMPEAAALRTLGMLFTASAIAVMMSAVYWILLAPSMPRFLFPLVVIGQIGAILLGLLVSFPLLYGAWLMFNSHLLGVRIGPRTSGHGSRLLAQVSALCELMSRLTVIVGVMVFVLAEAFGACVLLLHVIFLVVDKQYLFGFAPVGLWLLTIGSATPIVAYFLFLAGSVPPELLNLLSRLEANTRNKDAGEGQSAP